MNAIRNLVIVLGDQLDLTLSALDDFDAERDVVWMVENDTEATHVWCHKKRLVLFFAAMRHHRDALRKRGLKVVYHALAADRRHDSGPDFATLLSASINQQRPRRLVMTQSGDYRVQTMLQRCADAHELTLQIRPDRHFYCDIAAFALWSRGRSRWVLEDFYRAMRRQHDILMNGDQPTGGAWNFDKDNRKSFGRAGPGNLPHVRRFRPDDVTCDVIALVDTRYPDHPGQTRGFDLPVTRDEARTALRDFIAKRLSRFGSYQDALWTGMHFAYHSRLSAALNLHLLDPRECVNAAIAAYRNGDAPIASVEGFVRQILGWREFVRGVYWHEMPGYIQRNALRAQLPVPRAYWDGDTDMACVSNAMANVLDNGYAHHIQRLMVLGLFAMVAGVHPKTFHDWHMAMYVDALDWVSLPNALGMSQFGDGGVLGTKPYCASGNYINKMSNYCSNCRFDYRKATGDDACPVTTLYWDFLDRNLDAFEDNRRMIFQVKNLKKKRADEQLMTTIRKQAGVLRERIRAGKKV